MNRGFTILEIIVAIFVITIGVLAAYTATQQIISYTYRASSRLTAAYLAKEGIEIVRNIRDTNWLNFAASWDDGLTACTAGCEADYTTQSLAGGYAGDFLNIDANGFYSYQTTTSPTKFTRKIIIIPDGSDKLEVSVEVQWKEKGINYGPIIVRETLYDWFSI